MHLPFAFHWHSWSPTGSVWNCHQRPRLPLSQVSNQWVEMSNEISAAQGRNDAQPNGKGKGPYSVEIDFSAFGFVFSWSGSITVGGLQRRRRKELNRALRWKHSRAKSRQQLCLGSLLNGRSEGDNSFSAMFQFALPFEIIRPGTNEAPQNVGQLWMKKFFALTELTGIHC